MTVVPADERPFDAFPFADGPAVAVSVHYVDGVTGGNVLLMTTRAARAIATAMSGRGGRDAPDGDAAPTELELSAVAEAANQMFAAAASATGVVLGQDVEIAPPETQLLDAPRPPRRRSTRRRTRSARRSACAARTAGSCSSSRTRSSCA